jgi:hypothetical protein
LEGKFDEDDFYILKDGDFYDPLGYYFDKDGFDENGGRYDEQGYYIPCASEVTDGRQLVLTKEEIQALHPEGSFDEDGFYKLKDGDYFDPFGFYFNSEGLDSNGGNYDEAGYYQPGTSRDKSMLPISKDEIMKQPGKYSETGFYNLTAGGFYDQFGYFFNEHGLDEVGGFYENGIYQHPDEEYKDEE